MIKLRFKALLLDRMIMRSGPLEERHPTTGRRQSLKRSKVTKSTKMSSINGSLHQIMPPIRRLKQAFSTMQKNYLQPKFAKFSSTITLLISQEFLFLRGPKILQNLNKLRRLIVAIETSQSRRRKNGLNTVELLL